MDNEQEWRSYLISEMREIKNDVKIVRNEITTLKVKVAFFSSIIGSVASILWNKFFN
jgi:hypothetical protein